MRRDEHPGLPFSHRYATNAVKGAPVNHLVYSLSGSAGTWEQDIWETNIDIKGLKELLVIQLLILENTYFHLGAENANEPLAGCTQNYVFIHLNQIWIM
jgi:hypothetical protein